jgi:hypothetical protein
MRPDSAFPRPLLGTLLQEALIGAALLDAELRFVLVNDTLVNTHELSVDDHSERSVRRVFWGSAPQVEEVLYGALEPVGTPTPPLLERT